MTTTSGSRTCCACGKAFEPQARIGAVQVTCGAQECQRVRHAEACRRWHRRNRDVAATHYGDYVIPFRERDRRYQIRLRRLRRLREIRDEMARIAERVTHLVGETGTKQWPWLLGEAREACRVGGKKGRVAAAMMAQYSALGMWLLELGMVARRDDDGGMHLFVDPEDLEIRERMARMRAA